MKFSSEFEMCKAVTIILSGLLLPIRHKHIPEVPRSSQNNHADMLFLLNNGKMFIVEYKLRNPMDLLRQVNNHYRGTMAIGIVNQNLSKDFKNKYEYKPIFSYTGQDWEIEKISKYIFDDKGKVCIGTDYRKTQYRYDTAPIYYWGYKKMDSSFIGGLKTCKRLSFYQLYIMAVQNLQSHYNWELDFYLVHNILGFYEISTAKKHFDTAMKLR